MKRVWKSRSERGPSRDNHLTLTFPDKYMSVEKAAYKLKRFRQRVDRECGIVHTRTVPSVGNHKRGTTNEKLHLHVLAEFNELVGNTTLRKHWHAVSGGYMDIEPLYGPSDIQRINEYLDEQVLHPDVTHDWRSRKGSDPDEDNDRDENPDAPPPNDDDLPAPGPSVCQGGDEPPPNEDEPPAYG